MSYHHVSSVSMLALQAFYPFLPIAHARTAQPIEASSASPARAAMAARAQGTCSHPARQGMIVYLSYLSSVGFVPGSKAKHCSQVLGCKAANMALELLLHQNWPHLRRLGSKIRVVMCVILCADQQDVCQNKGHAVDCASCSQCLACHFQEGWGQ